MAVPVPALSASVLVRTRAYVQRAALSVHLQRAAPARCGAYSRREHGQLILPSGGTYCAQECVSRTRTARRAPGARRTEWRAAEPGARSRASALWTYVRTARSRCFHRFGSSGRRRRDSLSPFVEARGRRWRAVRSLQAARRALVPVTDPQSRSIPPPHRRCSGMVSERDLAGPRRAQQAFGDLAGAVRSIDRDAAAERGACGHIGVTNGP